MLTDIEIILVFCLGTPGNNLPLPKGESAPAYPRSPAGKKQKYYKPKIHQQ